MIKLSPPSDQCGENNASFFIDMQQVDQSMPESDPKRVETMGNTPISANKLKEKLQEMIS